MYDTIKGIFFQANFLPDGVKYWVFSIEKGDL